MNGSRSGKKFFWGVVIVFLALVEGYSGRIFSQDAGKKESGGAPSAPPAPVVTATVEEGAFSQPIRVTGTVEAIRQTTLAAEVKGALDQIFVEEGDRVTTGAALAQLRLLPISLVLKNAEATAKADAEKLRELKAGTREEDLAIAGTQFEEASTLAEIAKADYERSRKMSESGIISAGDFDSARQKREQAQAKMNVAQANYDRARVGPRAEEVAAAEAKAASSEAMAAMARDTMERATIRAPFSGVVTKKYCEVGTWVDVGDPLFDFEADQTIRVRSEVPESYFNTIRVGDPMEVTFESLPNETFTGKVSQLIPRANERSRAFPIKVQLDNSEHRVASGMLARITLEPSEDRKQSVFVPKDALVPRGPSASVFRVTHKEGKAFAEEVPVKTGRYFGEAVEVFGELKPGEQVIIRGNERVQPGQEVMLNNMMGNREGGANESGSMGDAK
ncbi:MAG: efflux RND transporter periplasmic adaptor subunit [bacterium]